MEFNSLQYEKAINKQVKALGAKTIKSINDYGGRLYAYITVDGEYHIEVSTGNPIHEMTHQGVEEFLRRDKNIFAWASSGSSVEAWQEYRPTAKLVRELVLQHFICSLAVDLAEAIMKTDSDAT